MKTRHLVKMSNEEMKERIIMLMEKVETEVPETYSDMQRILSDFDKLTKAYRIRILQSRRRQKEHSRQEV